MKAICIYFILFICTINNESLKVEGLKSQYAQNENLEFSVVNKGSKKENFYVSVEYFNNDKCEWGEFITDISNPASKITFIKTIGPHKKIKYSISVKEISNGNWFDVKKFRLKVVYDRNIQKMDCNSFSDSFEIKRAKLMRIKLSS
ncbi:MAG: hypothetical protein ABIN95_04395 [Mucilaginibacter sp.]